MPSWIAAEKAVEKGGGRAATPQNGNGMPDSNDDNGDRPHGMSLDSRVYLLADRIKNLTSEVKQIRAMLSEDKKDLITRLSKLEVTYQRVFGIILVFPIIGAVLGFIATYWPLFKPLVKP